MQDSSPKVRTTKNFYTNGNPYVDHSFPARKHARNYSLQEPVHHSPHWWIPSPLHHLGNHHKSPSHQKHNGHDQKSMTHLNHHNNDQKSSSHLDNHGNDQSHESRIEAIAAGQKRLMEMAREMSESSHELSMKDIVEVSMTSPDNRLAEDKHLLSKGDMQRKMEENSIKNNNSMNNINNNQKKVNIDRSASLEHGGHLIKMVFPFSVGSKKKTKKNVHPSSSNDGSTGRDSPKILLDSKDWGKVRSEEGEFGGSIRYCPSKSSSDSAHSHITNIRSPHDGGCWSFLCTGERQVRANHHKDNEDKEFPY